jgi:hypothetical protein
MPEIKHQSKRIAQVTARHRGILFKDDTAGSNQAELRGLNVGHQKVEHGGVGWARFHIQTEAPGLETEQFFALVGDG